MNVYSQKSLKVMPKRTSVKSTYTLSQEEKKFYEENGYLVIRGLVDLSTLNKCRERFIQVCNGTMNRGRITVVKETSLVKPGAKGEEFINKIQNLLHDHVFSCYAENPRLLDVVSQFIGEDITAIDSIMVNKPPGSKKHPPHQDLFYLPIQPADKIIAVWTAMDLVTLDNGCLFVVPGSHRQRELHPHGAVPDAVKFFHGILDEEAAAPLDKRVHLEMSPGDTVLFHPLLVHGSGPNVSKNYRKAMASHYADSSCQYVSVDVPPYDKVAKDMDVVLKKSGISMNYMESLKYYKSKQVKGVRSNL